MGSKHSLILAPVAVGSLVIAAGFLSQAGGGTSSVIFDDPNRSGEYSMEVTVEYMDDQQKRQTRTITSSTVDVHHSWNATTKRENVQQALDEAIESDDNTVGGEPLLETSGHGNGMLVSPSADSTAGNFSQVKIKKIDFNDTLTGQDDVWTKSPRDVVLAIIEPVGTITGHAGGELSDFSVSTLLGTVAVPLSSSMSKEELLRELALGIVSQGGVAWLGPGGDSLIVLVADPILGIGSSSTDDGLTARTTVLFAE